MLINEMSEIRIQWKKVVNISETVKKDWKTLKQLNKNLLHQTKIMAWI